MVVRALFLDPRRDCRPDSDPTLNATRFLDRGEVEVLVAVRRGSVMARHYDTIQDLPVVPLDLPPVAECGADNLWPRGIVRRVRAATQYLWAGGTLARTIRDASIEVLYVPHHPQALALLQVVQRLVKIPYVLHCRGAFDGTRRSYQAARQAGLVVTNTRATAQSLRGIIEDEAQIEVVYDGVLLPNRGEDRDLLRWRQGIQAEHFSVVIVGQTDRPEWIEGFFEFLPDIERESPQCSILFADTAPAAGFADRAQRIRNLAAQYRATDRIRTLFVGEDFGSVAAMADLIVVPVWNEQTALFVLESFAANKPVVGSVAGGMNELLQNASGFLLPPRDFTNLADAIIQLSESPSLCAALAGRGYRRFLECFHFSRYLAELAPLLCQAAALGGVAPSRHRTRKAGRGERIPVAEDRPPQEDSLQSE